MRTLIIDGTNAFIRNYTIVPTLSSNGSPNGGTYGFLKSLHSQINKSKAERVVIVFDGKSGSRRRKRINENYKEGRKPLKLNRNFEFEYENVEENKIWQIARLSEYLEDLPVYKIIIDDVEADDVIAYIVSYLEDDEKVVVSTDQDFFQLADSKTIIFSPTKKIFYTESKIYEDYTIYPKNFAITRAVIGDSSDNLKGVKGIGYKTIIKLFPFLSEDKEFTLQDIFDHCENNKEKSKKYSNILESKKIINQNLELMDLSDPFISAFSAKKIRSSLEFEPSLNATGFRKKLIEDGIKTLNDSFIQTFRFIK